MNQEEKVILSNFAKSVSGGFQIVENEFFFTGIKKTSKEAWSFCTEKGGKLYEPRDVDTMTKVTNHAKTEGIGEFWLGIHDKNKEGIFVYASDNSPIEFGNWADGEPNDHRSKEDCVLVNKNGEWNDIPCKHQKRSIVCARDKQGTVCYIENHFILR